MKKVLLKRAIAAFLKKHTDWTINKKQTLITRVFIFDSHIDALVCIARISVHAEVMQHHPEIIFSYKKVKVKLTTHTTKGLTEEDIKLAGKIDSLIQSK